MYMKFPHIAVRSVTTFSDGNYRLKTQKAPSTGGLDEDYEGQVEENILKLWERLKGKTPASRP